MKQCIIVVLLVVANALWADANKENFLKQQAFAEMQRVTGQIDVIDANVSDLAARVAKLEQKSGNAELRAEIDSLKAQVEDLKRQLSNQRGEIIRELGGKIAKLQPSTPVSAPTYSGPMKEYTVEKGDSLSLIAEAFKTSVPKLREINGLKTDNLRIGQKIRVPAK